VNQEAFFQSVLLAPEQCRVPYMIAGSVAAMLYGEPRLTNDMDVVVALAPEHVEPLLSLLQGDDYYVPSLAFVRSIVSDGGSFNIIHVQSASKVDLIVRRQNDFAVDEFSRRRPLPFTESRAPARRIQHSGAAIQPVGYLENHSTGQNSYSKYSQRFRGIALR